MKLKFQLLDVSYDIRGEEPVIVLYSRLYDNTSAVLFYRGFRPYFYAIPEKDVDLDNLVKAIKALSKPKSPILSVDVIKDLKYLGRPVIALKVTTLIPQFVRQYREEVASLPGVAEVLEADIRFAMRFLIDFNLYPMRWYIAEVKETGKIGGYRVQKFYDIIGSIEEDPESINKDPLSSITIFAFDIEAYNPQRSPNPSKDPIIIIGFGVMNGNNNIVKDVNLLVADDNNDSKLISVFIDTIKKIDPDIIIGYNQNRFDWPYLAARSRIHGIRLDVGRKTGEPQTSSYGHISIPGRLNVDLYDYAEELHEVKVKSLEEVVEYLGLRKPGDRVIIDWWRIAEYWDNPSKRPILIEYTRDDVRDTMMLGHVALPFIAQLSQISGLPMDQVMAASVGFRLEWRLMREAYKQRELVPNRVERHEERYPGAVVLKPKPGIHDNIAVLDFSSMYPNIMIKYNIGPDTLIPSGEEHSGEVYIAPEVGYKFRKYPDGFFKRVLTKLITIRKNIRREMSKYPKNSTIYKLLDNRQKAIKILANACYGYLGWTHARWYCRECAESVTAWGRQTIKKAIEYAKNLGLEVIYGDTDSIFVTYDPEKVNKLIDLIENELGFDIKLEKVYKKVFFTEAKKRYVGLTSDGRIDIVGFEAVRGDWSELAKETQLKVAEIILSTGDVDKAVEYVRRVINDLKTGNVDYNKLIIWKTLTKRPSEYEAAQPHVTAAKIMERAGYKVSPGMKIGYVIVRGVGPVSRRAKPYFMATIDEIDTGYYIDKQVVQAAMRILRYLGVTEKKLKMGSSQRSLLDYFS